MTSPIRLRDNGSGPSCPGSLSSHELGDEKPATYGITRHEWNQVFAILLFSFYFYQSRKDNNVEVQLVGFPRLDHCAKFIFILMSEFNTVDVRS